MFLAVLHTVLLFAILAVIGLGLVEYTVKPRLSGHLGAQSKRPDKQIVRISKSGVGAEGGMREGVA